ncbi:hypothetical protein BN961_00607 [Afipia felis]|uniref:Uncharacterized protein n=1 Tax=Afipia felis TaxID=1035 RepID=A0A090MLP7_AFIFE|nr:MULTISPECIES: hypothetical protein [Afipia]EFI52299.1 conserved hypothetical protein [Afipia sp. 1NLS2]RTL73761.1 MAG: hypothetical protein EKK36_13365 [Bradyrhizobiaceae bacterium]CEG07222.1 hypothetical protein BN961_00607 [Afipia felis]
MSKSARGHREKLDDALFDDWIVKEYRRRNGFTALILLVSTANLSVLPLRSTFTHMIGDELDWHQFSMLMRGAGVAWDGVLIMPVSDEDGGPIEDRRAAEELRALEDRVNEDRMVVNEGHFFDNWGRRMKVEPATAN